MSGQKNNEHANDAIVPVEFNDRPHTAGTQTPNALGNLKRAGVVAFAIALFFVVLAVLFVLPRYLQPGTPVAEPSKPEAPEKQVASTAPAPSEAPLDDEAATEMRRTNQSQLEEALALQQQLEARNVRQWAESEFEAALAQVGDGEKAYREQRYAAAQKFYAAAIASMNSLAARTTEIVSSSIADGYAQIDVKDAAAATKAFKFALAIEPEQPQALAGLARAESLDQVLALINEAEGYEELKQLGEALSRYEEALTLDGEAPGAASGIKRIKRTQLDAEYRKIMSQGLTAYEQKQDTKAKTAFERALKLKPNAPEAGEALAQVNNRILANKISASLSAAIKHEREEKWTQAAQQYRAAVSLDSELDGAANSARRADSRAKLDKQLNAVLDRPDRLTNEGVRKEAGVILARAHVISNPGPRLTGQINQLSQAIAVARTPIDVTIVSDNATEVTLYRVGPLGRFERHSLAILPGHYVVVGRRVGFRDVRVEFDVSPDHPNAMITVRCEQKLAFGS